MANNLPRAYSTARRSRELMPGLVAPSALLFLPGLKSGRRFFGGHRIGDDQRKS